MTVFGAILMLIGAALSGWGYFFDISVPSDSGLLESVTNLSLISQRAVIMTAGAGMFAGGCAFTAAGLVLDEIKAAIRADRADSE